MLVPTVENLIKLINCPEHDQQLVDVLLQLDIRVLNHVEQYAYGSNKNEGISFILKAESLLHFHNAPQDDSAFRVQAIHLYAQGYENYCQYSGTLMEGLEFTDTRKSVRAKLGIPNKSGGGKQKFYDNTQKWPEWDRYERNRYSINLTYYGEDENLVYVTIN